MADLKEGGDAGGDGGNGEAVLTTKTDDGIAILKVSSGPNFLTSPHPYRAPAPLFVCSRRGAHIFTHTHACMSAAVLCGPVSTAVIYTQSLSETRRRRLRLNRPHRLNCQHRVEVTVCHSREVSWEGLPRPGFLRILVGSTPALTLFLHAHVHSFLGDTRSRAE